MFGLNLGGLFSGLTKSSGGLGGLVGGILGGDKAGGIGGILGGILGGGKTGGANPLDGLIGRIADLAKNGPIDEGGSATEAMSAQGMSAAREQGGLAGAVQDLVKLVTTLVSALLSKLGLGSPAQPNSQNAGQANPMEQMLAAQPSQDPNASILAR